jgi:hypothetical protein
LNKKFVKNLWHLCLSVDNFLPTTMSRMFLFLALIMLLLAACSGGATPALGVAGQPTLVFIYTDG